MPNDLDGKKLAKQLLDDNESAFARSVDGRLQIDVPDLHAAPKLPVDRNHPVTRAAQG
jgi:hypothetical protein